MNLINIVNRIPIPEPYTEGEKIPWDDPEFSARMLKYHLSQDHDAASRRFNIIDKHVKFIDGLTGGPTKMLDLGCGPGFYASRFTSLGYKCRGIDFSPASVEYAEKQAEEAGQDIDYVLGDVRTAEYGEGYGLAAMIYGEFNVFKRKEILGILRKAHASLEDGGLFIAEPHSFEAIKSFGEASSEWYTAEGALFSDKPHMVLTEHFWYPDKAVSVNRHFVIDAASSEVKVHADAMVAYTNEQYEELFREAGFSKVDFHRTLTGENVNNDGHLMVIAARK